MAVLIDIPGLIYQIFSALLGAPGKPWYVLLFFRLGPIGIVFATLSDAFKLFTFFSKKTADIVAFIIALFFAYFGLYDLYMSLLQALFAPLFGEFSLALGLFVGTLALAFTNFAVGHFVAAIATAQLEKAEIDKMIVGKKTLDTIGGRMQEIAQHRQQGGGGSPPAGQGGQPPQGRGQQQPPQQG